MRVGADCSTFSQKNRMKKFLVERNLPGAANLSADELQEIATHGCSEITHPGKPYYWLQSFITEDKMYCIYIAESEASVREHARLTGLPVNTVAEIKTIFDPSMSDSLR